jgi:hypothetical protein
MENIKKHLFGLTFCLIIFCGLTLPGGGYGQGRCLIVSDIHFNPFFTNDGKYNLDRSLIEKLSKADVSAWKGILDKCASKAIDASLLGKKTDNWGQDSNYGILLSALNNMSSHFDSQHPPAFIVIAGDFIWHDDPCCNYKLKAKSIQFIASLFQEKFPNVPIIPTLGNNDSDKGDYIKQGNTFLGAFAKAWRLKENLMVDTDEFKKNNGYYRARVAKYPALNFIVLNSTLVGNSWIEEAKYTNEAEKLLLDMSKDLREAKEKKVWLISHIPPGTNAYGKGSEFWREDYSAKFIDTIVKYCSENEKSDSSVIQFMIASHTHLNDFKVIYKKANNRYEPVSYVRIVPSIGMDHHNNPSFEIAVFDERTLKVTNETTWYLDLTKIEKPVMGESVKWLDTLSLNNYLDSKTINCNTLNTYINKMAKSVDAMKEYVFFNGVGKDGGFSDKFLNAMKLKQK